MKRVLSSFLILFLILSFSINVFADTITAPNLSSEAVILMDQDTGKVLFGKNEKQKMYPASTTKLVTALIGVESLDLNKVVKVGEEANLADREASSAGLQLGKEVSVKNLIWGLLLPSGADSGNVLAVNVARAKSNNSAMEEKEAINYFVKLMNEKLKSLGCNDSNFSNIDGFHADDHYTTAYDLALIVRAAMKQEFIREVVKTYKYTIVGPSGTSATSWTNINEVINKSSKFYCEYATGVKTGHTTPAGQCLTSAATKGDLSVVSVTLKGKTADDRFRDTKAILEYGINNFVKKKLAKANEVVLKAKLVREYSSKMQEVELIAEKDINDTLLKAEADSIKQTYIWNEQNKVEWDNNKDETKISGILKKGQVVGTVQFKVNDKIIAETKLLSKNDAEIKDFMAPIKWLVFNYWLQLIIGIGILILVIIILMTIKNKSKKKYSY